MVCLVRISKALGKTRKNIRILRDPITKKILELKVGNDVSLIY